MRSADQCLRSMSYDKRSRLTFFCKKAIAEMEFVLGCFVSGSEAAPRYCQVVTAAFCVDSVFPWLPEYSWFLGPPPRQKQSSRKLTLHFDDTTDDKSHLTRYPTPPGSLKRPNPHTRVSKIFYCYNIGIIKSKGKEKDKR